MRIESTNTHVQYMYCISVHCPPQHCKEGDGYQRKSPHTKYERFEGLNILDAAKVPHCVGVLCISLYPLCMVVHVDNVDLHVNVCGYALWCCYGSFLSIFPRIKIACRIDAAGSASCV